MSASAQDTSAEVLGLRVGHTPERTRVVFDLSAARDYRTQTLQDPTRIVVDIPSSYAPAGQQSPPLRGTPIKTIRNTSRPGAEMRYVFEVEGKVEHRMFPLKPFGEHGHRLVLDIYPPGSQADMPAQDRSTTQLAPRHSESLEQRGVTPQNATRIANPASSGTAGEWSGYLALESRLFFNDARHPEQDDQNVSAAFEPEYYQDWQGGRQRLAFRPFFRYDANDDERTHADVRELYWRLKHERLVFKAGLDVVFWGVTESQHLVDIINQTDLVENIDGEDKLGQPMLNLDYMTDNWGTLQAWILPYFRDRTFPGEDGRLRTEPPVDTDEPLWDSSDEEEHIDYALRWSHYIGDWDIGLAHFSGTGRDPLLVPAIDKGEPTLLPFYLQIEQTSLDVQATKGAWLWKLEAIYNDNKVDDYFATVGGFEFTQFGIADSSADLGWLLEYHYDERDDPALAVFQKDIYAGLRWTGNDIAGTRLLAGVTVDLDNGSTFGNIEAVRRLGELWTITLESRIFTNIDDEDRLNFISEDDYVELQISRFF